jgi:hypothetical protein
MSYTPHQKNKLPMLVITACTVILILCACFMMLNVGNGLVWQSLFLVVAVVMIFFYTRYLSTTFTYTISTETDAFLVTQQKGKRLTTLCNLRLSTMHMVRPFEEGDGRGENLYSYLVTLNPSESTLLFFDDGERKVRVRIETDEFFYDLLVRTLEYNAHTEEE